MCKLFFLLRKFWSASTNIRFVQLRNDFRPVPLHWLRKSCRVLKLDFGELCYIGKIFSSTLFVKCPLIQIILYWYTIKKLNFTALLLNKQSPQITSVDRENRWSHTYQGKLGIIWYWLFFEKFPSSPVKLVKVGIFPRCLSTRLHQTFPRFRFRLNQTTTEAKLWKVIKRWQTNHQIKSYFTGRFTPNNKTQHWNKDFTERFTSSKI